MNIPPGNHPIAVRVDELSFRYPDGTPALERLSLIIRQGESVCLAGPNGAGKSTLLLILAGLMRGDGTVEIDGMEPRANRQLGLVFQDADDQLFCPTVAEDVAFGPRNQHLSESEVAERVKMALTAAGLNGFEERSAHHLSGGEKKRAAIAAVLACHPSVLALDEPWANLDARGSHAVTQIVRQFAGTRLVTSQDLFRAAEVCDRMIILDQGKVVADGDIEQLLRDPSLLAAHGVEYVQRCRFCSGPASGSSNKNAAPPPSSHS
jgi:cobalt/nickel transport system ATP-binding protein